MADAMYPSPVGAGASARAIYERRRRSETEADRRRLDLDRQWRAMVRAAHPVRGRLASALVPRAAASPASPDTEAWGIGADGERLVAEALARCPGIGTLHDRAVPGSRSNIDHLVVGRSGVFVIDTKAYRVDIGLSGRWGEEMLRCSGRDRSDLLRAAEAQARTVRAVLADAGWYGGDPVVPVLCFVGSSWLVRPPVTVGEVVICSPETLVGLVRARGSIPRDEVAALTTLLDEALPPRLISRR